jgi:hypothetical protein
LHKEYILWPVIPAIWEAEVAEIWCEVNLSKKCETLLEKLKEKGLRVWLK